MFLTHLDEEGNSSPAILIEDSTAANRAVNISEFVNIPPDGLLKTDVPANDFYRACNIEWESAQKGRYEEAIVQWKKALELNPGEASIHLNLGVAFARAGKPDEAITEYRKALEIKPNDAEAYYHLGMLMADTGKFDEAVAHFERGLELRPKDSCSPQKRCSILLTDPVTVRNMSQRRFRRSAPSEVHAATFSSEYSW